MTKGLHRGARALAVLAGASLLAAAACEGGGRRESGTGAPSTSAPAITTPPGSAGSTSSTAEDQPDLGAVKLAVAKVASLSQPVAIALRLGDDAMYVAEKGGRVRRVVHGQGGGDPTVDPSPLLDLSGDVSRGSEQGLLGLTFSTDGNKLYVDYTDRSGDTQVVEYGFAAGKVDTRSRRVVLTVDQPFANHNGGEVAFGPDGKLYVGLGDGGSEYDPNRIGQDLRTPLAKILRIDPQPSGAAGYTVPADNPFVGRAGARPETWVWGLRNPWRFSWDRRTGDLWIADVGQDRWEEIDVLTPGTARGANLGWSLMDASHPFHGNNPPGGVLPLTEYTHDGGNCAVTGGYVYRGSRIPRLSGAYVYGDYCSGRVWAVVQAGGKVTAQRQLALGTDMGTVLSFGEDAAGELYVLAGDGVYRLTPG